MLLKEYTRLSQIDGWFASEKYDGIRAIWDGSNFISRLGNVLNVPDKFKNAMPSIPLDGELYMGKNTLLKLRTLLRRNVTQINEWDDLNFMVFDIPEHKATFKIRLLILFTLNLPTFCKIVEQRLIKNNNHLKHLLTNKLKNDCEGLVIRNPNAFYEQKRSHNIMKLKKEHLTLFL